MKTMKVNMFVYSLMFSIAVLVYFGKIACWPFRAKYFYFCF